MLVEAAMDSVGTVAVEIVARMHADGCLIGPTLPLNRKVFKYRCIRCAPSLPCLSWSTPGVELDEGGKRPGPRKEEDGHD